MQNENRQTEVENQPGERSPEQENPKRNDGGGVSNNKGESDAPDLGTWAIADDQQHGDPSKGSHKLQ